MRSQPGYDSLWRPRWVDKQTTERLTRQKEITEPPMEFSTSHGYTGCNTTHVLTQNSPRD